MIMLLLLSSGRLLVVKHDGCGMVIGSGCYVLMVGNMSFVPMVSDCYMARPYVRPWCYDG